MSLYRKYRPQKFNEVIGQEHIVKTLQGALKSNQVGHAYIFSGPRGTGKTSIARILAKAVNCLNLKDSEPCDVCNICKEITAGNFLDLIEIDAASNRGIDEIRDLKEKIVFVPNVGKYKVYIIDEVHMLTREAFNALLKTLEEPPSHALFILATTEAHKIPLTIHSRCQSFDFHKIDSSKMLGGIRQIAQKEKIKIDDISLKKIISLSEGSIRDSLSYLDQIHAFSGGEEIEEHLLEDILGLEKQESLVEILRLIRNKEIKNIIIFVNGLIDDGVDLKVFLKNLVVFIRKLLLVKIDEELLSDEILEKEKIKKLIEDFDLNDLINLAETINEVINSSKFSFLPQLYFELAIIKLLRNKEEILGTEHTIFIDGRKNIEAEITNKKEKIEKPKILKNDSSSIINEEPIKKNNHDFLQKIREENLSIYMALQSSDIFEDNNNFVIKLANKFYFDRLNEENNYQFLKNKLAEYFGKEKELKIINLEKEIKKERDVISDAIAVFGGEVIE